MPDLRINIHSFNKIYAKSLYSKGLWFTIGGLAGILIFNLDKIIIGKYVSLSLVASFIITLKLYTLTEKVLGQIINVSRPYLAQIYGRQNYRKLFDIYITLTTFSLLIGGLVSSFIFIVNKYFISFWVGDEFYIGDTVNLFFALNFIFQFAVLPNRAFLASTFYKIAAHNLTRVAEGILNLILSLTLVKKYGINGVILASILATIFFSNIFLNLYSSQFFKEHNIKMDWKYYMPYSIITLPIILYYINYFMPKYFLFFSSIILLMVTIVIFNSFKIWSNKLKINELIAVK